MAKDVTDDTAATPAKPAFRLGVATVAKPCLIGAVVLSVLHVALSH